MIPTATQLIGMYGFLPMLIGLFLARHGLLFLAFRNLPALIARREALPTGFRLREPLKLGVPYLAARLAVLWLIGIPAAFIVIGIVLTIQWGLPGLPLLLVSSLYLAIGGLADRAIVTQLRARQGIAADWRKRIA